MLMIKKSFGTLIGLYIIKQSNKPKSTPNIKEN